MALRMLASSGLLAAFRFRCSALAKVSFSSLVRARVKWLPPSGIGRCQMIFAAVGDDEVRGVGADVQDDRAALLAARGVVRGFVLAGVLRLGASAGRPS